jgi:hypothetical protein
MPSLLCFMLLPLLLALFCFGQWLLCILWKSVCEWMLRYCVHFLVTLHVITQNYSVFYNIVKVLDCFMNVIFKMGRYCNANIPQLQLASITSSPSTLNSTSASLISVLQQLTALDRNALASIMYHKTIQFTGASLTDSDIHNPPTP